MTVAVHASREDEPAILDRFYEYGSDIGFKPFYHKARDFDPYEYNAFYEEVIGANLDYLSALSYSHRGTPNTQQVEAVHSALLVHELRLTGGNPLVLLDGGPNTVDLFIQAIGELEDELPAVVHCQQAERYYPTTLLADLTARWVAEQIENDEYSYRDPLLRVLPADQTHEHWGKAYSGLYSETQQPYTPVELPQRWGGSVRERIRCWFEGAVATDQSADPPTTDSLTPIVNRLRNSGYERIATILSEV